MDQATGLTYNPTTRFPNDEGFPVSDDENKNAMVDLERLKLSSRTLYSDVCES